MESLSIAFEQTETSFEPGETIHLTAQWQLESSPKDGEVRLFWYTKGKGDQDVGIIKREHFQPSGSTGSTGSTSNTGSQSFSFKLPRGPYSFSGKLISLIWAVELIFKPSESTARTEFVMAPGKVEINPESIGF